MNDKSKKKRQERVRKQKILQREAAVQDRKKRSVEEKTEREERRVFNKTQRERLGYMEGLEEPDVKPEDSVLERNIKVLESALAEHDALIQYREEHKEEAGKLFEEARQQQAEYAKNFKEGADDRLE